MDISKASNFERFVFDVTGRDRGIRARPVGEAGAGRRLRPVRHAVVGERAGCRLRLGTQHACRPPGDDSRDRDALRPRHRSAHGRRRQGRPRASRRRRRRSSAWRRRCRPSSRRRSARRSGRDPARPADVARPRRRGRSTARRCAPMRSGSRPSSRRTPPRPDAALPRNLKPSTCPITHAPRPCLAVHAISSPACGWRCSCR